MYINEYTLPESDARLTFEKPAGWHVVFWDYIKKLIYFWHR